MVELPAKNTAPGFGGVAVSRFSRAATFFSHLANGSPSRGGGATGGWAARVVSRGARIGRPVRKGSRQDSPTASGACPILSPHYAFHPRFARSTPLPPPHTRRP